MSLAITQLLNEDILERAAIWKSTNNLHCLVFIFVPKTNGFPRAGFSFYPIYYWTKDKQTPNSPDLRDVNQVNGFLPDLNMFGLAPVSSTTHTKRKPKTFCYSGLLQSSVYAKVTCCRLLHSSRIAAGCQRSQLCAKKVGNVNSPCWLLEGETHLTARAFINHGHTP